MFGSIFMRKNGRLAGNNKQCEAPLFARKLKIKHLKLAFLLHNILHAVFKSLTFLEIITLLRSPQGTWEKKKVR